MIQLEEVVLRKLKTAQTPLIAIESCTGGLISNLLTNVSGASEIFWGGMVVYDNTAKLGLGVPLSLLQEKGAVSREVAQNLAEAGMIHLANQLSATPSSSLIKPKGFACIATTGIAGPGGGSPNKPVGLCFIALAMSGKKTRLEEFRADPNLPRHKMKELFANRALELIRESV